MKTGIIPGQVKTTKGDPTLPMAGGHRILLNMVSTNGEWRNDSFSQALSKRWPMVEKEYRRGYLAQRDFKLGNVQKVNIKSDFTVLNLICIRDIPVIEDIEVCLKKVVKIAKDSGSSVHLPWNIDWIQLGGHEALVTVSNAGINVTFYSEEEDSDQ